MASLAELLKAFCVALGVDLGGALLAAGAAALTGGFPLRELSRWAHDLKVWGVVAAVGGSFPSVQQIEEGLLYFQVRTLVRQMVQILVALAGANAGYALARALGGEAP